MKLSILEFTREQINELVNFMLTFAKNGEQKEALPVLDVNGVSVSPTLCEFCGGALNISIRAINGDEVHDDILVYSVHSQTVSLLMGGYPEKVNHINSRLMLMDSLIAVEILRKHIGKYIVNEWLFLDQELSALKSAN